MNKRLRKLWQFIERNRVAVALGLIMAITIAFRFWRINSLPPGLFPDEAANGLDIFRIQDGDIRALYNTNGPRESLFFFLQAIFVTIFGNTAWALRIAPALIGSGAVLVTYLWVKEWFDKRTALLAAAFMATSSWAVTMSRIGFRASMVPLMIGLFAWLLTKAIKTGKLYYYGLSGLILGLGFYTYISYRMMPFIILGLLVYGVIWQRTWLKNHLKPLLLTGLITAIVLIPLGLYTVKHPGDVLGGRSSVSFTNPELNEGQPLKALADSMVKTALMFNIKGDPNYRHNLGNEPMLNGLVGIMFILGILLSLRNFKDIRHFALLLIFGAMLVPEVLTIEGIPHGLRAIGVLPAVYIFAALGIRELLRRWRVVFPKNPAALVLAIILIASSLTFSAYYDWKRYFVVWANDPETYAAYSEDVTTMAHYLNRHAETKEKYAIVHGFSDITLQYLTKHNTTYQRFDPHQVNNIQPAAGALMVVAAEWRPKLPELESWRLKEIVKSNYRTGLVLFYVYEYKGAN